MLPLHNHSLTFLLDHSSNILICSVYFKNKYVGQNRSITLVPLNSSSHISLHSLTVVANFAKVSVHAVSYFSSAINCSTHHSSACPQPCNETVPIWFGKIFMLPILWTFFFAHGTWPLIWHSDHGFALKHLCSLSCLTPDPAEFPLLHWLFLPSWCSWCLYLVEIFELGTEFQEHFSSYLTSPSRCPKVALT